MKNPDAIVFIESSSTGAGEVTAKYAKEIGLITILVSRAPDAYNENIKKYIDVFLKCETNALERTTEKVRELADSYAIKGVVTTNDIFVPHASFVANQFNLPSMKYEDVMNVRNKYRMRAALAKGNGFLNPKFKIVDSLDEAIATAENFGYPLIFKPQDLNDSIHVNLIHNVDDVKYYWNNIKRFWDKNEYDQEVAREVLVEEYIQGEEYSIETYQFAGEEIQVIGITKKIMTNLENSFFVELGVTFPHDDLNDRVFPVIAKALQDLKINCGVIHTEFRITEDGQIKILEINPRLIGDMAGRMVFNGIDNEDEILDNGALVIGAFKSKGKEYFYPPKSNIDVIARVITTGDTIEASYERAKQAVSVAKFS